MINPARVQAFLDIFGSWDPTLAIVMGAAVVASAVAYLVKRWMAHPVLADRFVVPESRRIDWQLLTGATIFGTGWGLVGLCPGPAISGLVLGMWQPWLFVAAMLAGMIVHKLSFKGVNQCR
nr:DUF6691 family protein [Sphingomonas xanthus]